MAETAGSDRISADWMRGYAAGVTAYENYLLDELASDGLLNPDYSGAAILDPLQAEKVRLSLLRIVRRIISERAAAAWGVRKDSQGQRQNSDRK